MKLNCDLGESFGSWKMGEDELIIPLIDMANVACGFHASDPLVMQKTVKLLKENGVQIGAHPGYPDLVGFGRRSLKCSFEEIEAFVIYQIGALSGVCKSLGTKVEYVKPHGALYNDMMRDEVVLKAIMSAISKIDNSLKLMILSTTKNSYYEKLAKEFGIGLIYEVFADRAYTNEGLLVPRTQEGAVIHDLHVVLDRINLLKKEGKLISIDGSEIELRADSMCVHGDNKEAVAFVKALREYIDEV
ncbi:5-oxoprolinase subunit PxpA [Sulfurospirillum sp. 1307]|jgi:UPF0271 protein